MGFQVLFNGWIFLGAASYWFGGKYNWICQAVDYSTNPDAIQALSLAWWFYLSKFIDFFDSIFFILRKKFDHLSPQHLVECGTLWFTVRCTLTTFCPPVAPGSRDISGGRGISPRCSLFSLWWSLSMASWRLFTPPVASLSASTSF